MEPKLKWWEKLWANLCVWTFIVGPGVLLLSALGGWQLVWLFVQAWVVVLLLGNLGAVLLWAAALFVGGIGIFVAELCDALWLGGGAAVKRYLRKLFQA